MTNYSDKIKISPVYSFLIALSFTTLCGVYFMVVLSHFVELDFDANTALYIVLLLSLVFTLSMQLFSNWEIPSNHYGVYFFQNKPLKQFILTPGFHLPILNCKKYPNEKLILNDSIIINNLLTKNNLHIDLDLNVSWRNVNIYSKAEHDGFDFSKFYSTRLFSILTSLISGANGLRDTEVNGSIIDLQIKLLYELNQSVAKYGEEITDVVIVNIRNQSKIRIKDIEEIASLELLVEQINLRIKNGTSPEDSFRQIAILKGWIKPDESIYRIENIEFILSYFKK